MMRAPISVLAALTLSVLACALPFAPTVDDRTNPSGVDSSGTSGGPSSGDAGGSPDAPAGQVLLQDDFGDPSSGWEVGDYEGGTVGYSSDIYQVQSIGDGNVMWGLAGLDLADVVIEVTTYQSSAPENDNNGYGVACRVKEEGDGYYLLISGDGFYGIMSSDGNEFDQLVDWTESNVINQGNATNTIRATCAGSTLTLEVNGQELASIDDSRFSSGDIALAAVSYESEPTQIHFDDVRVTSP
jgi:hypothetical protein